MSLTPITRQMAASDQAGSSLIEILVSLVILAIGILGIFALQTSSLKSNQNAYLRTQATLLGQEMTERMLANQLGVNSGSYDNPTATQNTNCATTTGCSPAAMAANDIFEWNTQVALVLPSGSGIVCRDTTPTGGTVASPGCDSGSSGDFYAIKIWWDGDRNGAADQTLVMGLQL